MASPADGGEGRGHAAFLSGSSGKKLNGGGGGRGITRRCSRLVKEQRARLYILRRCATMLLCWYVQGQGDD
ncbi:hypothetical protein H6P81_010127 [Aristolochia fimbriata]|uniref:Uncharacterized protein n=1 Tax=Aristolochia fimbriata TaxID=158543 RepID=A0AAV7ERA6_ARIFI|nr:hypothetical protein H6P81_010127 [Aristolochia fimbriata]